MYRMVERAKKQMGSLAVRRAAERVSRAESVAQQVQSGAEPLNIEAYYRIIFGGKAKSSSLKSLYENLRFNLDEDTRARLDRAKVTATGITKVETKAGPNIPTIDASNASEFLERAVAIGKRVASHGDKISLDVFRARVFGCVLPRQDALKLTRQLALSLNPEQRLQLESAWLRATGRKMGNGGLEELPRPDYLQRADAVVEGAAQAGRRLRKGEFEAAVLGDTARPVDHNLRGRYSHFRLSLSEAARQQLDEAMQWATDLCAGRGISQENVQERVARANALAEAARASGRSVTPREFYSTVMNSTARNVDVAFSRWLAYLTPTHRQQLLEAKTVATASQRANPPRSQRGAITVDGLVTLVMPIRVVPPLLRKTWDVALSPELAQMRQGMQTGVLNFAGRLIAEAVSGNRNYFETLTARNVATDLGSYTLVSTATRYATNSLQNLPVLRVAPAGMWGVAALGIQIGLSAFLAEGLRGKLVSGEMLKRYAFTGFGAAGLTVGAGYAIKQSTNVMKLIQMAKLASNVGKVTPMGWVASIVLTQLVFNQLEGIQQKLDIIELHQWVSDDVAAVLALDRQLLAAALAGGDVDRELLNQVDAKLNFMRSEMLRLARETDAPQVELMVFDRLPVDPRLELSDQFSLDEDDQPVDMDGNVMPDPMIKGYKTLLSPNWRTQAEQLTQYQRERAVLLGNP